MKQSNTLISQLMLQLTPQMSRTFKRVEDRWSVLFASCPSAQNSSSAISHLITGQRSIPKPYITTYADPAHPRVPTPLLQDLSAAISVLWPTFSARAELFRSLTTFVLTNIDPIDQPDLLPHELPNSPNLEATALFMTTVMWYSICRDYSRI